MSKEAVLALLERAATDDAFIHRLSGDFAAETREYELTKEETTALSKGDIGWLEDRLGKLDKRKRTWLDLRVQQLRSAADGGVEARVKEILPEFSPTRQSLIPILQRVQAELGYLPEEAMLAVAQYVGVPESNVFGVASFYAQFRFTPVGRKKVCVCRGTACHVRGAAALLEEAESLLGIKVGETTPDRQFTLETVACIGCCALSPCVTVNNEVHAKLTRSTLRDAIFERGGEK